MKSITVGSVEITALTDIEGAFFRLDQIFPGSGAITPIAGQLIARQYSQREEFEADRHGADILQKVGLPREVMADTLTWLVQASGGSKGGLFATHPATAERIEALRRAR